MTFQELADEAFRDLMKKHDRPYDTRDAFRKSAKAADQNRRARRRKAAQGPKTQTARRRPAGAFLNHCPLTVTSSPVHPW